MNRNGLAAVSVTLLCWVSPDVHSAEFPIGGFVLNVPAKFQGPVALKSEAMVNAYTFTVPGAVLEKSTGLQLVVQETDMLASQLTEAELVEISRRYLSNMLQAVGRRRTDFRKSEPTAITLAGAPASEVSWTGRMNGHMSNGRLYCLATGSDILFLHVMGPGAVPDADMKTAIQAIKALRRRANK